MLGDGVKQWIGQQVCLAPLTCCSMYSLSVIMMLSLCLSGPIGLCISCGFKTVTYPTSQWGHCCLSEHRTLERGPKLFNHHCLPLTNRRSEDLDSGIKWISEFRSPVYSTAHIAGSIALRQVFFLYKLLFLTNFCRTMPTTGTSNASNNSRGRGSWSRGQDNPGASSSTVVHPNGSAEITFQAHGKHLY